MKEQDEKIRDENLTQQVIDPKTGRDITGEYINQRLKKLEIVAENIIQAAIKKFNQDQSNKKNIYQEAYWELHEKLGMGSIGPATAAAGPLMGKKKQKLAEVLAIQDKDRL